MPGSPQGLKDSLMRAIDDTGNVKDMLLLVQVITDLQSIVLTAEDLTVTRLGLYINNVRRKTTDKSLAKRMKDLLKDWKQLVQQQHLTTPLQSNGLTPQLTTPTPVVTPPTPSLATPIINEPSPNLTYPPKVGVASKPNSALSHRKLLLNKLSAFKPQTTPTTTPLPTETSEVTYPTNSVVPPTSLVAVSNGKPNNELTVRLPLKRLSSWQQEEEDEDFVVRIPLSLVNVGGAYNGPDLNDDIAMNSNNSLSSLPSPQPIPSSLSTSLSTSMSTSLPSSLPLSSPPPLPSSLPSPLPFSSSLSSSLSIQSNTTTSNDQTSIIIDESLNISIPLSLLSAPPLNKRTQLRNTSMDTPLRAPPTQLINIPPPTDCIHGRDGIIGQDGQWYYWTDIIPPCNSNCDEMITVLPYVYIDGLITEQ